MDIKLIKELTKLMKDNDLVELEVESEELKVKLSKGSRALAPFAAPAGSQMAAPVYAQAPAAAPAAPAAAPAEDTSKFKPIISPIPGTVYLRPNPESNPFTTVGAQVNNDQVVCLVEAMKVFNEIKAEGISGTVKKICVEDGQAVEYGTVLYLIG